MDTAAAGDHLEELLTAVAAYGLPSSASRWPAAVLAEDEFDRLCAAAFTERLSGLLLDAVEDGALPATEAQADRAAACAATWYRRTRVLDAELVDVHQVLDRAVIEHRVVKGSATAVLAYGDTLRRPYADVDVAIAPGAFGEALALLTADRWCRLEPDRRPGLVERLAQSVTLRCGDVELDLHRMLVHPPAGDRLPAGPAFDVPPRPFALDGVTLPGLPTADAIVHSAAHAVFDHQLTSELLRARDLVSLASLATPSERRARGRAWGLEATVERKVASSRRRLGVDVGDALVEPPGQEEAAAIAAHARDRSVGRLWSLPRWRDKAAWSLATALPTSEYLRFTGETRWGRIRRAASRSGRSMAT